MKIYVLTENMPGGKFGAEHGISYYIQHNGQRILFDTGHTDLFLRNASTLGIDLLKNTDTIVLSHGHWDHGDGLPKLLAAHQAINPGAKLHSDRGEAVQFISHPEIFQTRYRKGENENIGIKVNLSELETAFNIQLSAKPIEIEPGIFYMGEIPRNTVFESKTTAFVLENQEADFIIDDSGLVLVEKDEIILISGCAHSGICNMMEYAKEITGLNKFKAVLGGFHLKLNNLQTKETIKYIKSQKIDQIFPSHCTQLPALAAFYQEFEFQQLKTGMILEF
ncbi:MAG: MBL fold metallo-hydrolase [Bacteroidales bacterium]|nr:MBL fold metallo-hydrolase [Bacteroidales bacterium]MCF8390805.1 MBL fold metallo-hydrolase [Bacteroidales bacterium]